MNYIARLQAEQRNDRAELEALYVGISNLRAHLASDKFQSDPTIQVADVARWLDSITNQAADAVYVEMDKTFAQKGAN